MRFNELYEDWENGKLTQLEAAKILGVSDLTFRQYLVRYEQKGPEELIDYRIEKDSHLRALLIECYSLLFVPQEDHLLKPAKSTRNYRKERAILLFLQRLWQSLLEYTSLILAIKKQELVMTFYVI